MMGRMFTHAGEKMKWLH